MKILQVPPRFYPRIVRKRTSSILSSQKLLKLRMTLKYEFSVARNIVEGISIKGLG